MSVSISALKTRRLFQGVALLVSVLFITGQLFDCCLVNESFTRAVKGAFHLAEAKARPAEDGGDSHPHCHGHAAGNQSETLSAEIRLALDARFAPDGSCLSEQAFSAKPMVASESAQAPLPLPFLDWVLQPELPKSFFFERPRPQNKSSPPLYLTTLRLLV